MIETWYVLEDGAKVPPRDVKRDAQGVLRHKDGRAVAMRGPVPRTRSVEVSSAASAPKFGDAGPAVDAGGDEAKDMAPESPKRFYKTRESKAD